MDTVSDYIGYFFRWFPVKAALASVVTYCTMYFGVEPVVFYWYCAFSTLDLLVGMWYAAMVHASYLRFARLWFYRLSVQLAIIALIGGLFHMVFAITGRLVEVVNWMLLLCSLVDLGSALDKLAFMGVPLPQFLMPVINAVRRRTAYHIGNVVHDPKLTEELSAVLSVKDAVAMHKREGEEPVLEFVEKDGER